MATITLAMVQSQITGWWNTLTQLQQGKSVRIGDRTWTAEDIDKIMAIIEKLEAKERELEANTSGGISVRGAYPIED